MICYTYMWDVVCMRDVMCMLRYYVYVYVIFSCLYPCYISAHMFAYIRPTSSTFHTALVVFTRKRSLYIYIYIYICIYLYVCACVLACVCVRTCMWLCMSCLMYEWMLSHLSVNSMFFQLDSIVFMDAGKRVSGVCFSERRTRLKLPDPIDLDASHLITNIRSMK